MVNNLGLEDEIIVMLICLVILSRKRKRNFTSKHFIRKRSKHKNIKNFYSKIKLKYNSNNKFDGYHYKKKIVNYQNMTKITDKRQSRVISLQSEIYYNPESRCLLQTYTFIDHNFSPHMMIFFTV